MKTDNKGFLIEDKDFMENHFVGIWMKSVGKGRLC